MRASEFYNPEIGINVRSDGNIDYADLIVDGKKKLETRNSNSLRPYVGKRVSIVKTGKGRAYAIGEVTIGEPINVDEEQFRKLEKEHLVPAGSKFDIVSGGTKFLYPMINAARYDRPKKVSHGIISRKVFVENRKMKSSEIISEVFDSPYPLRWKHHRTPYFKASYAFATLEDGTTLSISFQPGGYDGPNSYYIEFSRGHEHSITGMGDSQRVFATVLAAIKKFVDLEQPKTLEITVVKTEDPKRSRFKLYKKMIDRYAASAGYESSVNNYDNDSVFKLTRK